MQDRQGKILVCVSDMSDSSQVETTARAVHAALDIRSSVESRHAATIFLESVKAGDIQVLGSTASGLVKQRSLSSEIRHYGLKLLQYLVRMRWEELNAQNRALLTELVIGLVQEIATPQEEWPLKSQTAALVSEVLRHEGAFIWQGLLPKLTNLATVNTSYAELVVMALRWLPEDVTVYNEDLEGDRRRQLLLGLTQALPQILPLFYKLLDVHFSEAVRLQQQNQLDVARQHGTVVTATLNALLAYVEWAPVNDMANHGLIEACGYLLNALDFQLHAGEFLKQIAARKRPMDDNVSVYDCALRCVFEALSSASTAIQNEKFTGNKENVPEFTERLCEAMVALGSHNLECFVGFPEHFTLFLQQMLGFFQHGKVGVHYSALLFWLAILREKPPDSGMILESSLMKGKMGILEPTDKEKKGALVIISDEVYTRLLDIAFHLFLSNSYKTQYNQGPTGADEYFSNSGDHSNYRGRLLDMVRLVAFQRPAIAVMQISQKIKECCGSNFCSEQYTSLLESSQRLLEVIIHSIFDGENNSSTVNFPSLQTDLEGVLSLLLLAKWNDPVNIEIHGRLLDALGPFLRSSPAATLAVVNKIFALLTSLPVGSRGIGKNPTVVDSSRARLQVCTSFLRIAKATDKAISPHMEVIWKHVSELQGQGLLLQGEQNVIAEAFLIIGSAAGRQCQAQVLDWSLKPLQERWAQSNLQNQYLCHPQDLVELLTRETLNRSQNEEMWSIFHSVTFFERILKRCASQPLEWIHGGISTADTGSFTHPMMGHLMWIIPSLLKLMRCIHCFWSPSLKPLLPSSLQGALLMSAAEQASLIGEVGSKTSRVNASALYGIETSGNDGKEGEIRNWLKGVRDSGYSTLGLAAAQFSDLFFGYMDCEAVKVALLENLEAMEFRHVRYLVHSVIIPFVRSCPAHQRDLWLGQILPRLLIFCEQALSNSWMNLVRDGAVKVSEGGSKNGGHGLKVEVVEEKMLRDLSREICALLSQLASPALNVNLPSGDQLLQSSHTELCVVGGSDPFGSDCMMRFVMQHQDIAKASLSICIKALKWPDSDAVHKAIVFCGAIITIAAISNDAQLQNFVAQDMFTAIIEALTIESNVSAQAELVSLFRIIYLLMAPQNAAPRQVLQSSPSITEEALSSFEKALTNTASAKEQKQYIKILLLQAGGNNLKALKASKSANLITNLSKSIGE